MRHDDYGRGGRLRFGAPTLSGPFLDPLYRRRQHDPRVLYAGNSVMYGGLVGAAFREQQRVVVFHVGNRRLARQSAVKIVEAAHAGAEAIDGEHGWKQERREKGASERRSPLEGWDGLRIAGGGRAGRGGKAGMSGPHWTREGNINC